MGTVRRLAPAAGDVTLGQAAEAYLVTLGGAEQASTRRTYSRILRRVVAEFGAETAPDEVDAERFAAWFRSQRAAGPRPRGTSPSMPSGQPRCTGSGTAGSPPTSPGCSSGASRGPTAAAPCPAARSTSCSPGKDIRLRERTLWRMLYETAARSAEVLALDVGDLDLPNRCARVRRKGGAIDIIVWQTGTARLPPRLLQGRHAGPVFRDRAEGPGAAPRGRPGRARTRPAQLSAGRGTVCEGLRRRHPAPAQALSADARCRDRNRDADAHEAIRSYLGQVAGQVRASQRRGADAPPGRTRPSAETGRDAPRTEDVCI